MFFHKILQYPYFLKCVCMFLQCFPPKHGNVHICRHKSIPKRHFYNVSNSLVTPNPWKHRYLQCFLQFFHAGPLKHLYKKSFKNIVVCSVFTVFSVKTTVIYTFFGIKSVQSTGFCSFQCSGIQKTFNSLLSTPLFTMFSSIFPCSNAAGQLKHMYECFFTVFFTMFSVKNTVIYTFVGIKSVQNTGFCSVFNALASKNLSTYRYSVFSFLSVFPLPEAYQNDPKFNFNTSDTQKIVEKSRKHHLILVSVRNRFCPPPS